MGYAENRFCSKTQKSLTLLGVPVLRVSTPALFGIEPEEVSEKILKIREVYTKRGQGGCTYRATSRSGGVRRTFS